MYTAINWAMDLGFYAGFSALTCALWWILGRRADRKRLRDGRLAAHASCLLYTSRTSTGFWPRPPGMLWLTDKCRT